MKKVFFSFIFLILLFFSSGCTTTNDEFYLNEFKEENGILVLKVNNDCTVFSFINYVDNGNKNTWKVYKDVEGTTEIPTKTINLNVGDNYYYILVVDSSNYEKIYKVNVRRLKLCKISFSDDSGIVYDEFFVQEGENITPLESPIKKGYSFDGWTFDFSDVITDDLIIYAKWSPKSYNIILDSNIDSSYENICKIVYYNQYYELPELSREGYIFKGWYHFEDRINNNGYWQYDVEENFSLTAKWEKEKYKISYVDEHNNIFFQDVVEYNEYYHLLSFEKEGYVFNGWLYNGQNVLNGPWQITNNVTLKPNITPNQYKIHLNYGEESGGKVEVLNVKYNSNVLLPDPKLKGYTFNGWYMDNKKVVDFTYTYLKDIELICKWSENAYEVKLSNPSTITHYYVTFNHMKSEYEDEIYEVKVGEYILIPENKCTEDELFLGWFKDINDEIPFDFSNPIMETITLYAKYENLNIYNQVSVGDTVQESIGYDGIWTYTFVARFDGVIRVKTTIKDIKNNIVGFDIDIYKNSTSNTGIKMIVENLRLGYVNSIKKNDEAIIDFYVKYGETFTFRCTEGYYSRPYSGENIIISELIYLEKVDLFKDYITLSMNAHEYIISVTYNQNFDFGYIYYNGFTFKGWFTEPNGKGKKLTDEKGKSIIPWNVTDISEVYAYFVPND